MELPEPAGRPFSALIAEIEKGEIKDPQFQREFVWDLKKVREANGQHRKGLSNRNLYFLAYKGKA